MKLFVVFLFSITSFTCVAAPKPSDYEVLGITGPVLANVNKRLHELQDSHALDEADPNQLQAQLLKAMQPFGYFHPHIQCQKSNNTLHIQIDPGNPVRIASVHVQLLGEGEQDPVLQALKHELPIQAGQVLSIETYNQVKFNWINTAEHLGFVHANFKKSEIVIDEDHNKADITLIFDTGSLYYFGQIQFDPTHIDPKLLHRFIPFQDGAPYSTDKVLQLNNRLSASGYFNSVILKPQFTDSTGVPVEVHLEPVSKYSYTLGGGFGTDTGLRGRADLHVVPVNRLGHVFNASAQGSFNQNVLQTQYLIPGLDPIQDQYSLSGNFSNLKYDSGASNALSVSLAKLHHVDNFQSNLSLNALYEGFNYTLQPNAYQFLFYPKAGLTWSHTQNKLFSPTGYSLGLNGLAASKLVLSKLNMAQLTFDARGAYTIDALRLRLYGHVLQGLTLSNDVNQVPLSLALFLGGTENLKGYAYNSQGPGKSIGYGGFEIQKETKKNWYVLGFFDAGYVNNPLVKNPLMDVGLGLMWVSPIGPIKVGVAQALTDGFQRQSGTNPRLVISMGSDL